MTREVSQDSQELFRLVAENVTDFAVFMTDLAGRVLSWNPGVGSLLGYPEEEWLGQHSSVIFTPEDLGRGADRGEMEVALAAGRAEDRRLHVRRDGSRFWADGFLMLLRDGRGEPRAFAKILRDDTARKVAEEARERLLHEREAERSRMEQILRQIPVGVNVVEAPTGRSLFSNAEAAALIGHPVTLEEGYGHYAHFGAEHADGTRYAPEEYPTVRALLHGEEIKGEEMLYRRPDGRLSTLSVNSAPIRDREGRVVAAATVFTDITARKLRERERERFLSVGSDLLVVGGFDRRFRWVSPAWERALGWTPEEITTRDWLDLIHPEDREASAALAERVFLGEEVVSFENRYRHRNGSYRWLDWRVTSYPEEGLLYGAASDVTAHKQAEAERERLLEAEREARREAERRSAQSEMLAAINRDIAALLDLKDVTARICRAARELTGAEGASFVIAEGAEVFYAEEDSAAPLWKGRRFEAARCVSGRAILNGEPVFIADIRADARVPREEYAATYVRGVAVVPVRAEGTSGAIGLYWATPHAASAYEREVLEALAGSAAIALVNARLFEESQKARKEAEEANRLKDEFLATLSHELRTPLTSILGWTRLLSEGRLDPATAKKALETIDRNATAQSQIIEDVLDVSRIISGKLRLHVGPVDLASVVQGAADAVALAAEARGVRLSLDLDPRPLTVTGDPTRLQQVVWNLLTNAVKFTETGGSVNVSLRPSGARAEVVVSDTGQGIAPEVLPHVFERFRQAEGSTDRRHGGLGLGLAIVRHLVESHGGSVEAESPGAGKGAMFRVFLPLVGAQGPAAQEAAAIKGELPSRAGVGCPPELSGLRVLVVDDDEDSRVLVKNVLEMCGAEVTAFGTAREALAGVERLRPDVLVSDLGMPVEDGYWLIRQVRALPEERGGKTPAAVLTAYAGAEDRVRTLRAGFQNHVTKPAEPQELVAVVANLAGRNGGR